MSSRDSILAGIRRNTVKQYEMPELTLDTITYEDKITSFMEVLKQMGGEPVLLQPGEDVNTLIQTLYPKAECIASNLPGISCATFNPDELEDPRELNGTDLSVVEGSFGVVENGAIWIPVQVKHKAIYFISNALVILLDKNEIVHTMNEAYTRLENSADYRFGTFMSGPSKTADIEQALVFGAHGPIRVSVILK